MHSLRISLVLLILMLTGVDIAIAAGVGAGPTMVDPGDGEGIQLISGFCGARIYGEGLTLFFNYFQCIWRWLLSIVGGVAVLNGVIGGTMIMMAGDDSGMRGDGINKLKFSIVGLLIVTFAGAILRLLNPTFYE